MVCIWILQTHYRYSSVLSLYEYFFSITDSVQTRFCIKSVLVQIMVTSDREWQWGIVIDDDFYTDRCGYRTVDFKILIYKGRHVLV